MSDEILESDLPEDTPILSPAFIVGGAITTGVNDNLPEDTGEVVTIELVVFIPAAGSLAIMPLVADIDIAEAIGFTDTPINTEDPS